MTTDQPLIKYQKVIKVGNSLALTLDKDFVKATNAKAGDILAVVSDPHATQMVIAHIDNMPKDEKQHAELERRQAQALLMAKISPEFLAWVDETLDDDAYVFRFLANL